jgi:competence protein CoiA
LALIEGGALEVPFTTIQRIADVAWPSRKWVFEVQCSPISLEEVQARCADYARLGYAVLWILHERCFNQRKVGAAEQLLRAQGCYFTNMSAQGRGVFYDQFEVVEGRKRRHRGPPLEVNPTQLTKLPQQNKELPSCLASRTWRAEGDLWDRILRGEHPEEQLKRLLDSQQRKGKPLSLLTLIKQSCCALGRAWLRACSN